MNKSFLIYEDQYYLLHQSTSCLIPGYLILSSKEEVFSFSRMEKENLLRLGPMLALIYTCLENIIKPEIIYCARFGEKIPLVHFHIFPRSTSLANLYRENNNLSQTSDINGLKLMDWAITNKKIFENSENLLHNVFLLQQEFNKHSALLGLWTTHSTTN